MRIVVLQCGADAPPFSSLLARAGITAAPPHQHYEVSLVPTRRELSVIDPVAAELLPVDPEPTVEEIAQQKSVPHLGQPQPAPQRPSEPLRVIVVGTDAALAAVATYLMRKNLLWVELAHIPTAASTAAKNWQIRSGRGLDAAGALSGVTMPVPLIRDDTGHAIVGYALLTEPGISGLSSATGFFGEVYVDEHKMFTGTCPGLQIRPTPTAPGIVADELPAPESSAAASTSAPPSLWQKLRGRRGRSSVRPPHQPMTGRAVQVGSTGFRFVRDGIESKKPREKTTLYRHLRDLQIVH